MVDAAPPAPADVPPVVAVVVTCDPGWWLEPCLRALVAQDYPQLAVLVIDAGSEFDPTPRVAVVAPNAYVRRVRRRRGFGAAANEVLEVVEGASHFVFCHDDVAPATNAVRLLVEEALRSNAGIVAPKLVDWWAADRMLAAGMGADGYGRAVPLLERGELDQQQHDVVRDVFFAPSACLLARADLFSTLGGFDTGYGLVGEDLDLAWRGHLAGARVVFAPAARVRHIEVTDNGRRALDGSLRAGAAETAPAGIGSIETGPAVAGESGRPDAGADMAAASTAAGSTAAGSTAAGSTAAGSTAAGSTAAGAADVPAGEGVGEGSERDDAAHADSVLGEGEREPPTAGAAAVLSGAADGSGELDTSSAVAVVAADPGETPGGDAGETEWWDLRRWDEEDDARTTEAVAAAAARGGRRRRHHDVFGPDPGEDEEWEPAWTGRRRRGPSQGGAEPMQHDVIAGDTPTPARPRGPDAAALDELRAEARLRAVASDYGFARAIGRLTAMLALSLAAAAVALLRRGGAAAREVMRPWRVLGRDARAIRRRRAATRQIRSVGDQAVIALQARGSGGLRTALAAAPYADTTEARPLSWPPGRRLGSAGGWVAFAVVVYGTRRLIVGHLPTIGEFAAWPSLHTLSSVAASGWRTTGLGTAGPAPTAVGLLTLAGAVVVGHTTLLQHVLVLGMLPLGALGALRLARPLGSARARLAALVAYLAVPLPYNAIAEGRWSGLVCYAALPWLLGLLARSTGLAPFDGSLVDAVGGSGVSGATGASAGPDAGPGAGPRARPPRPALSGPRRIVAGSLLLGVAGAVEPALLPLAVVIALAIAIGIAVTGRGGIGLRAVRLSLGSAAGAALLLAPWSIGWLPPVGEWAAFSGPAAGGRAAHLSTLLRFQTGPLGAGPLGYALLVAAAFPLLVGREWRVAWATRLWIVALTSFALAWAGQHGALGIGWPPVDVLLAPAAAAIALSAGLGIAAFELDLPGYHFGWRQVASAVAAVAAVAACLPVVFRSVDGGWREPTTGFEGVLPWMAAKRADGDFRVLWVGAPAVLPLAGWRLDRHTAYATSIDGVPDVTDQWPGTSRGPTRLLAQALTLTRRGLTSDVGHLLAPMSVRYLVVVNAASPFASSPADLQPVGTDLTVGLASQLDLETVDRSPAFTVYQNDAWAPMRVRLPDGAVAAAQLDDPRVAGTVDLAAGTAVLPRTSGPTTARGPLSAGAVVEVGAAPSGHWHLQVAGADAPRQPAFGSANLFTVARDGAATLHYETPLGWRLALAAEALLWAVALGIVVRGRRHRLEPEVAEPAAPPAAPILVGASR